MNKKGNVFGIIIFVAILFIILFLGFMLVVGSSLLNWTFDNITPELTNLGQIGDVNMTAAADYTITPANSLVQSTTWLTGVLYALALIGSVGFAFYMRESPSKILMAFYFMLMVILIMGSIFISNMYEDFYNGVDEFGSILHEYTLLSFFIIHSPAIFTVIGFITGIILFSGLQEEEYQYA